MIDESYKSPIRRDPSIHSRAIEFSQHLLNSLVMFCDDVFHVVCIVFVTIGCVFMLYCYCSILLCLFTMFLCTLLFSYVLCTYVSCFAGSFSFI